ASTATVNPFKSFFAGGFGSVGGVVVTGLSDNCFDWTYPVRFPLNVSLVISYHEPLFAWTTTFVFCDAQPAAVLLASGFERIVTISGEIYFSPMTGFSCSTWKLGSFARATITENSSRVIAASGLKPFPVPFEMPAFVIFAMSS